MNPLIEAYVQSRRYQSEKNRVVNGRLEPRWTDYPLFGEMLYAHRFIEYGLNGCDNSDECIYSHGLMSLELCVSGRTLRFSGGSMYRPRPGDLLVAKANELHGDHLAAPSVFDRHCFVFSRAAFAGLGAEADRLLAFIADREDGQRNLLRPSGEDGVQLLVAAERAEALLRAGGPFADVAAYSHILRLFALAADCARQTDAAELREPFPELVSEALRYIDENLTSLAEVREVAGGLHVSPEHLSRVFSKSTGSTLSDYIRERRLAKAKKLLSGGGSVTDACFLSGYNSVSYFIQLFKLSAGMTPSRYKREMRG